MPPLVFIAGVALLGVWQGVYIYSAAQRNRSPSNKGSGIANWLYKKAESRKSYYVRIALPSLLILLLFVTDLISGCINGRYCYTHVYTYIGFGAASLVGAVVSILIILKLGRSFKNVKEVRNIFFDVVEDASQEHSAYLLLAAPNPGQYSYKEEERITNPGKIYIEDFKRIVDRARRKGLSKKPNSSIQEPIVHIACLPWESGTDGNGHVWPDSQFNDRDANVVHESGFDDSPMGKFIKDFYDYHSRNDEFGWNGYRGYVIGFLKLLQDFASKNIIEIVWLTKKEITVKQIDMIIMLKSQTYAYLGAYDYGRFQFNILDVHEQKKSVENLFRILLQLYDGKPLSWCSKKTNAISTLRVA